MQTVLPTATGKCPGRHIFIINFNRSDPTSIKPFHAGITTVADEQTGVGKAHLCELQPQQMEAIRKGGVVAVSIDLDELGGVSMVVHIGGLRALQIEVPGTAAAVYPTVVFPESMQGPVALAFPDACAESRHVWHQQCDTLRNLVPPELTQAVPYPLSAMQGTWGGVLGVMDSVLAAGGIVTAADLDNEGDQHSRNQGHIDAAWSVLEVLGAAMCAVFGFLGVYGPFEPAVEVIPGLNMRSCPVAALAHVRVCTSCDGTCSEGLVCQQIKILLGYVYANDGLEGHQDANKRLQLFSAKRFGGDGEGAPKSRLGSCYGVIIGRSTGALRLLASCSPANLASYPPDTVHGPNAPDDDDGRNHENHKVAHALGAGETTRLHLHDAFHSYGHKCKKR